MPPKDHALLSASSAERWLHCTAAPRFESQFPESTTTYAEEGRLAHEFCELKVLKKFTTQLNTRSYNIRLKKLRADSRYNEEMERTSDRYLEQLTELAMTFPAAPYVVPEVRVDFSDYVPEGFGTCDCIMIGGSTLAITDYKHGQGVPVSAEGNPQMRLYALGALKRYLPIFGSAISEVLMTIVQPRISDTPSKERITVEELKAWGDSIKPVAQIAYLGMGTFTPGDHCKFCRGKALCKARADVNSAIFEFKDCVPEGSDKPAKFGQGTLTDQEVGELLAKSKGVKKWLEDLESYALAACLAGKTIPGFKAVAGRSNRAFTDTDAAIAAVIAAGYDEALIYDRKAKTLAQLEELLGAAEFNKLVGKFVIKPQGKPALVPAADPRPAYSQAAADFAEAVEGGKNAE